MTGHAAVAEIRNDSPGMGKKIPRFIKKTVSQTGTEDRGQRAIDENRLRNLLGQPFAFTDLVEEKHAAENRQHPHQSVITDIERSDRKKTGLKSQTTVIGRIIRYAKLVRMSCLSLFERKREGRSHSQLAADVDSLAVSFDNMLDDRQSEPRTALLA